jgi:hypothetical protein
MSTITVDDDEYVPQMPPRETIEVYVDYNFRGRMKPSTYIYYVDETITGKEDSEDEDSVYNRMPAKKTFTVEANCRVRGRKKAIDHGFSDPENTDDNTSIDSNNSIPHIATLHVI